MHINPILRADSYKASHFLQYAEGTQYVSSYIESRGGAASHTVFFGLQMYMQDYLAKPITAGDIAEAKDFILAHGEPFNESGWKHILNKHGGYMPVRIEALPEGEVVPTRTPLVQIINTDPECFWVPSYMETALLRAVWYPTTVATRSALFKATIKESLDRTSDNPDAAIQFKLHDFGARGVSSGESAAIGGAAHLVNFSGSDTLEGVYYANHFYHEKMSAFSIPAAEHSTMTELGREGELQQITRMLDKFLKPGKIVAIVSDSYDLFNAVDNYFGTALKDRIMNSGGTVVVRPDSGDPLEIVPEVIERLMAKFGSTTNKKGFRVLPDCIRVIQGDGVTVETVKAILAELEKRKISADNIAFGCGGELLQRLTRDDHKFAQKASAAFIGHDSNTLTMFDEINDMNIEAGQMTCVNGIWRDVFKDPITDQGKRSKAGRHAVLEDYSTVRLETLGGRRNLLVPVYENSNILVDHRLSDVRARANAGLPRLMQAAA